MSSKKASRQDSLFAEAEDDQETGAATETSSEPANPPAYVDAPIPFTQEEIDFYAMASAILDSSKMLFEPVSDKQEKGLQQEFMSYFGKISAACNEVKRGVQHVRIGKDLLGNEWVFDDNYLESEEKSARFVYPFFLMWMTKKICFMAEPDMLDKAASTIEQMTDKVKSLKAENEGLKASLKELQETAQKDAGKSAFARGHQSRLQSKRGRRLPVHPRGK